MGEYLTERERERERERGEGDRRERESDRARKGREINFKGRRGVGEKK